MIIGVPKETSPDETRVALVPAMVPSLLAAGHQLLIEENAGVAAGYENNDFTNRGAKLIRDRAGLFAESQMLFVVRGPGANPESGDDDIRLMHEGQALIGFLEPLAARASAEKLARAGVSAFALELVPRITRAQAMDALSSMASLAGYKSVLLAAARLPKIFPMMITAAGTLSPARVFVIGAGVAGLQACATARRLGAVVSAYDVRPAVKEQVESVGAKFIEFSLSVAGAEDSGGYATVQSDAFYHRQQEEMARVISEQDVVVTTAAVPGKPAPVLITADMVKRMPPGSVIVDIAAERGGNCELTVPGETVSRHGVTIIGSLNLPATIPFHASQMLAKNITALFTHIAANGLNFRMEDPIISATLLCHNGLIVHPMVSDGIPERNDGDISTGRTA
jgi:NAD(P) transhydrogenase subunit alpha